MIARKIRIRRRTDEVFIVARIRYAMEVFAEFGEDGGWVEVQGLERVKFLENGSIRVDFSPDHLEVINDDQRGEGSFSSLPKQFRLGDGDE